jgi:ankyrin repeat protein
MSDEWYPIFPSASVELEQPEFRGASRNSPIARPSVPFNYPLREDPPLQRKKKGYHRLKCERCRSQHKPVWGASYRSYFESYIANFVQQCEPRGRVWPARCKRCLDAGEDCSKPLTSSQALKAKKGSSAFEAKAREDQHIDIKLDQFAALHCIKRLLIDTPRKLESSALSKGSSENEPASPEDEPEISDSSSPFYAPKIHDVDLSSTVDGFKYLLIHSIACSQENALKALLEVHSRWRYPDAVLNLGLSLATSKANLEFLRLLIKGGANINTPIENGRTPLMIACEYGLLDMATFILVDQKANPNHQTDYGKTALMFACQRGHVDIVALLVHHSRVDMEVQDGSGWTAITYACFGGFDSIASYLIEHGADITTKASDGRNLLFASTYGNLLSMIQLLSSRGVNLKEKSKAGFTLLMTAMPKGDEMIVDYLLTTDVDIDAQNEYGDTALSLALRCQASPHIIQKLVDGGADLTASHKTHGSVLHLAVSLRNSQAVKTLLNCGADVDVLAEVNNVSVTPLSIAARLGEVEIAKLLLAHGANTKAVGMNGSTALLEACSRGHSSIVRLLLDAGAIPRSKDEAELETALEMLNVAGSKGHYEVVGLLLKPYASSPISNLPGIMALRLACTKEDLTLARALLKNRSYFVDGERSLLAALEWARVAGNHSIVYLIECYLKADYEYYRDNAIAL